MNIKNLRNFTTEAFLGWVFLIFVAAVAAFVVGLAIGFGVRAFDFAWRIALWTFVVSAPAIVVSCLIDSKHDAIYSGYLLLGSVGGVIGLVYSIYLAITNSLPNSAELSVVIAKIAFAAALFGAVLSLPELLKLQNRK